MIKGNGTPVRSYLYMSNLAVWLWTILFRGRACTPYNVGSENGVSIRGLADAVSAFFSPRVGVTVCKEPLPAAAPSCYIPDTSRAKRELGLEETVPLNEALEKTIRWNRNNHL